MPVNDVTFVSAKGVEQGPVQYDGATNWLFDRYLTESSLFVALKLRRNKRFSWSSLFARE